jgi:RHS repeat-associated protein
MLMPGRNFNASGVKDFRFGFNGKMNDNDVKNVEGGQQDYGMRIYDTRIGRFLSRDPLSKKYPELTPYQFSSNRPIDGIDLDGLEYVTFHVIVTKDASGKPIFQKHIGDEFRGMTEKQIFDIHKESDFSKNFYSRYNESFGPEGRGFKWLYFDEKGKQIGDPMWQMRPSSNSILLNNDVIGYYSGAGAITKFGPGLSNGNYSELKNDYDFSYKPMGYADEISKEHDYIQETTIKQPQGWLEDTRTIASDFRLLYKSLNPNLIFCKSAEDVDRTLKINAFFTMVLQYKSWKINEMKKNGLDINKPESQLKIILKDWNPSSMDLKATKFLLNKTNGGATEKERNTVKPVQLKIPLKFKRI